MSVLTLAPTHRFTVQDYYGMAQAGILAPDARVELLEGQILDMLPIGSFHSGTFNRLNHFFSRLGGGRWIVSGQTPVRLNDQSEPQPDILLLRPRDDFYAKSHPVPADVFLLVEVSDSSVRFDREEKLPAYARAGVGEFWLVNLVEKVIEVYRDPFVEAGLYRSTKRFRAGEEIALSAFPETVVPVAELLVSR